jgi:hypothetical protein
VRSGSEEELKELEEKASAEDEGKYDCHRISIFLFLLLSRIPRTDPCLADGALLGTPWLDDLSALRLAHLLLLRLGIACVRLTLLRCLCLQQLC